MARTSNKEEDVIKGYRIFFFWRNGYEATSVRMLGKKEMGVNFLFILALE
jgi:hypothetical protein